MDGTRKRLDSIQVIRAAAFILIFLSHADLIETGPVGVSLFLVLSGFCMTYSYLDRPEKTTEPGFVNNLRFAWEKVRKLYPLHIVTLLFVALVIFGGLVAHKGPAKEAAEQGGYFAANALLLQSWIPWRDGYFSFNAVSWYLSTSAFSYFLFPYVFPAVQSKDNKRILKLAGTSLFLMALTAAVLGAGKQYWGWTRDIQKWVTYICPLYRAGDFIIGLAAGYFFLTRKDPLKGKARNTAAEIIVILIMAAQVYIYNSDTSRAANWMLSLFWLPASCAIIYLFAVREGAVSGFLSKSRALIWIGNISGEAFLIHQICIKAAEYVTENKWIVAAAAFALTLACTVIWRAVRAKVKIPALGL